MKTHTLPALPEDIIDLLPGWQRKYGKLKLVTMAPLDKDPQLLVFRSATKGEANALINESRYNPIDAEQRFVSVLLLYPDSFSFAGLTDSDFSDLLQNLWGSDAFGDPAKFLDQLDDHREEIENSVDSLVEVFLCAAFHKSPEYINTLTSDQITKLLAMSEIILGRELPVEAKGRVSKRQQDPAALREQLRQQKLAQRTQKRQDAWEEKMGISEEKEPAPPDVKTHEGGPVDMVKENAALYRVRPELRWK